MACVRARAAAAARTAAGAPRRLPLARRRRAHISRGRLTSQPASPGAPASLPYDDSETELSIVVEVRGVTHLQSPPPPPLARCSVPRGGR